MYHGIFAFCADFIGMSIVNIGLFFGIMHVEMEHVSLAKADFSL